MNELEILFEDASIIVCYKPSGVAVQTKRFGEQDMESLLRNYLARKGEKPYIGIVHRLDQPVEGVMVFAKSPKAAAELNRQMQQRGFGKYYYAVVTGTLQQQKGTLTDYLKKDGRTNISSVTDAKTPGAKKAVLSYEVLGSRNGQSLVRVCLETGRHHQIRVQMAHAGCPLIGDKKYGAKDASGMRGIALCSYHIDFIHPVTGKKMLYEITPKSSFFEDFQAELTAHTDGGN